MARLELPSKEADLVAALDREISAAEMERNVWKTSWSIVDAYLLGCRHFKIENRTTGTLEIAFETYSGRLGFRYEKVLKAFVNECGRYMKMDISPVATRQSESLDSLRKASIGHATLGSVTQPMSLDKLKPTAIPMMLKYGTVGFQNWESEQYGVTTDHIEVIHPRELLGLPAWTDGLSNLRGIVRKRYVPWDWLKENLQARFGKRVQANLEKMKAIDVPWGASPPGEAGLISGGGTVEAGGRKHYANSRHETLLGDYKVGPNMKAEPADKPRGLPEHQGRSFVPLEETYVLDDNPAFLCRYVIKVGDVVFLDESYEGKRMVMPLHIARHADTGRFYGRGFVSPLLPAADQIEQMLGSYYKNIIDFDIYGTVLYPDSWGVDLDLLKATRRPKVGKYTPDIGAPHAKEVHVQPVSSGTMPAQAAQLGVSLLDDLAGQGPMFSGQASKRMDSASGHGFLFDVMNISLSMPSHSLADALAGSYGKLLQVVKERLERDPQQKLTLTTITDAVAGVVIDPKSGSIQLDSNPIPDPWEIKIDVKDRTPRDTNARKQELIGLVQMQLVTPTQFWITSFEENLDFPGAPRDLWESYRKALWQIIVLFGDGETPGEIITNPLSTNAEVQLIAVQNFMNRIEYALAEVEVQDAFEKWKEMLEQMTGRGFPVGLPPPEVLAQAQQQGAFGQSPMGM